jgi:hypothetical protein
MGESLPVRCVHGGARLDDPGVHVEGVPVEERMIAARSLVPRRSREMLADIAGDLEPGCMLETEE